MVKNFNKTSLWISKGFTLIELVVASALLVTVSVVGVAAYRSYADAQVLQNIAYDVSLMLQKAKSRAQTQVKPANIVSCQTNSLNGFEVKFCDRPSSSCANPVTGRYELHIVCGGVRTSVEGRNVPSNVSFVNPTSPTFYFRVIHGTVNPGSVTLSSGGKQKIIQVSGLGDITIQ